MLRFAATLSLAVLAAAHLSGLQTPPRHVTTAHALAKYGHFFHGAQVSFLGTVTQAAGVPVVPLGAKQRVAVIWQQPQGPEGQLVLRGTFVDLARLEPADPQLARIDTQKILDALNEGRPPARDQLFLLLAASHENYEPAVQANVRALALDPARYAGKQVTISGRFRGKNLLGDQPVSPAKSPHEYILRVADASVWISGLRPRGHGFTLDADSRRDTREWVRVTGIVRHEPPLVWVEGKTIDIAKPETEQAPQAAPLPPGPSPEIIFSAPLDGESNVPTGVVLRVQFSRDIDPASLKDQIAVAYALRSDGSTQGTPPQAVTKYVPANRAVEIRFTGPLAPFTSVIIAFGDKVKATDGVAMKPTRISFTTGR